MRHEFSTLPPRALGFIASALLCVHVIGCEDPPPDETEGAFLLGVRAELPNEPSPTLSGGMGETLEGLEGLRVRVTRVEAIHRMVADDPSTETRIVIDEEERTFELLGSLEEQAPRQLGFFNIPEGHVTQLRFLVTDMSLVLRGEEHAVRVPSGEQSGLKVEPIDGVPFEIRRGERTGARVVLNPFEQLIRNRGQGFLMKPVLVAEHVTLEELSQILLDRVVVRFRPGVTLARVEEINSEVGTTILDRDPRTNYYVLGLPTSITLEEALRFYHDHDDVDFTLPDNLVYYRQVVPCDAQFQNPGPFTQVNAPQAWAVAQGNTAALLSVIDNSFDLANPDMINNYFINQGELLGVAAFDADGDGTVTAAEVTGFDTDGDGLITFVDLNAPPPAAIAGVCPAGQNPNPPTCDPLDLVDGVGGNIGFEDGNDNDGNGRVDDLVGWDFRNNDNLVHTPGITGCAPAHGVGVAGVVAAIGAAPPPPPAACPSGLVAGMNWVGRLLPVVQGGGSTNTATRAASYLAISYAVGLGADAINASWGITYAQGADPGCNLSLANLGDKYTDMLPVLNQEAASLALGNTVLVAAVDNCAQNDDNANLFDWPPELNHPNVVAVSGIQTNVAPSTLSGSVAFGTGTVDIVAPSQNHTVLDFGGGTNVCSGTSYATPLVTGTIGLIIANNANPPLQGNAATVISRLLCNATVVPGLAGQVGGGGRVLNVNASVVNANGCP